jgi:hypothetical protein
MANRVAPLPVKLVVFAGYHPASSQSQIEKRLAQCETTCSRIYLPKLTYRGRNVGFPSVRRVLSVAEDQLSVYKKIKHDGFLIQPRPEFDTRGEMREFIQQENQEDGTALMVCDSHLYGFTQMYHASYRTAGMDQDPQDICAELVVGLKLAIKFDVSYWGVTRHMPEGLVDALPLHARSPMRVKPAYLHNFVVTMPSSRGHYDKVDYLEDLSRCLNELRTGGSIGTFTHYRGRFDVSENNHESEQIEEHEKCERVLLKKYGETAVRQLYKKQDRFNSPKRG